MKGVLVAVKRKDSHSLVVSLLLCIMRATAPHVVRQ